MSERASCWSITINNPKASEYSCELPAKWMLQGQLEEGAEGTLHYQGMLTTPQVRFSAVKKIFPRAHIEVARNKSALQKYVSKEETRIATVDTNVSTIPTLFDYQHKIASRWNDDEFDELLEKWKKLDDAKKTIGDIALDYIDSLVAEDIEAGLNGVEYIAINPMWRSAWKRFWKAMVYRERKKIESQDIQDAPQNETVRQEEDVSQTEESV